jgi:RNA polymerase sigma factor (sigma-70 family)
VKSATAREVTWMSGQAAGDRHVVERIAAGDRDALTALYTTYQAPLFRYLLQLTNDRGLAEEVLQDTLEGRSSVQTWLIGIARRQAHNTLRRRALPRADVAELEILPSSNPEPEDAVLAKAEQEELATAIRWLSPVHREVLTLTFMHDLSYGEIARVVGVPEGTVKSRLSNAKRALRALLKGAEEVEK